MSRSDSYSGLERSYSASTDQRIGPEMFRALPSISVVVRPPWVGMRPETSPVRERKLALRTKFTTRWSAA